MGVDAGEVERAWRARIEYCEILKISGGWDTPECEGITRESPGSDPPAPADTAPPSASDILITAASTIDAHGAGLTIQPARASYINIPTLAHAASPTQTLTTTVLGHPVTIVLEATSFSFDFGDGSPPVVSASPGAPWPDTTNQHTYTHPMDSVRITLTTTWAGTATSPFTGQTATINGLVTTTETSNPFPVKRAHIILTDTADERPRHQPATRASLRAH
ncbi:hypothetical protein M3T53_09835, partial [Actinomyces sp. B33]|uniref:hypothetical protein n=1 Tax=Actinomyces sp. B33 TaxID=2942131 RepID=UPI002340447A